MNTRCSGFAFHLLLRNVRIVRSRALGHDWPLKLLQANNSSSAWCVLSRARGRLARVPQETCHWGHPLNMGHRVSRRPGGAWVPAVPLLRGCSPGPRRLPREALHVLRGFQSKNRSAVTLCVAEVTHPRPESSATYLKALRVAV